MRRLLRDNGLSIVVFALFFTFLLGQSIVGFFDYNSTEKEHGRPPVGYTEYLRSGDFIEAVFENWESEFLQMGLYVLLTVFLYQKGSAESKDPEAEEPVDADPRESRDHPDAAWPVRRGGLALKLYENSLSLTFIALFLFSFAMHAVGGTSAYSQEQIEHGGAPVSVIEYVSTSRFWFESLQNWQSEFVAVGALAVLSIFLRQKGSSQSKRVAHPHSETGG
jgi:hypothetical protein